ncbi:hypothetical protein Tb10.61.0020 [Trypanosoma brucei brucei TREU927]|uniref:Uncharacterized protein n=1 Tax=Trypanosoma brucei brucei (strain 927/4 GUTat10.1) TaxID=185431 RepID=Q387P4_TRYB2|nr:hypothetical protein Tb10.61.0020 [Trypanosoma brucei brucei TREU927]EAN78978.1 hypothetical protein Tb10.61.0020 [Trypanosoma brucei brucei TREU927]
MQFLFGISSQVLCCPFSDKPVKHTNPKKGRSAPTTVTFLTKRCNVVLSDRTTRVRVPLARNPSPLQYPTLHLRKNIPLDLCYANQDLHYRRVHPRLALSASSSPPRHVYIGEGYTFSQRNIAALTKGIMGNHAHGA